MAYWIKGPSTLAEDDESLHAGLTKDLLLGNLGRMIGESGPRYQSISHSPTLYMEHVYTVADEWEDVTPAWWYWPVPVRRSSGGAHRSLRVLLSGRTKTAGCTATLRVYPLHRPEVSLVVDTALGLPAEPTYGEADFAGVAWSTQEIAIGIVTPGRLGSTATHGAGLPLTEYDVVYLHGLVWFDTPAVGEYVRLRSPMVEEIP